MLTALWFAAGARTPAQEQPVVAAYYTGSFPPSEIPAALLTHVIFAFGRMRAGTCAPARPQREEILAGLRALRDAHPNLRVLVSLGGWGGDAPFVAAAGSAQTRRAFVASCVDEFIVRGGMDGIDIDWEFPVRGGPALGPPHPEERAEATLLLTELRRQLDALSARTGRRYLLTAATPAGRFQTGGAYDPAQSYDLAAIATCVDWLNLMTYDLNTGFSPVSNFNTPMRVVPGDPTPAAQRIWNNVTGAVQYYENAGVPADKIVLGTAFYGRFFFGVSARNAGLFSAYSSAGFGPSWRGIEARFLSDPAWQRYWSAAAEVPWMYDARTHAFLSYDDPESIAVKANFARAAGLRGVMMWQLGSDDAQWSLLRALAKPFLGQR